MGGVDDAGELRLVKHAYRTGAVIDGVVAASMVMPERFGARLRYREPFDVERREYRYAMRFGAPLMAGWTGLLLWAERKPVERRGVLALTILVIAGLMANDGRAVLAGEARPVAVAPTLAMQAGLLGLFGTAWARARRQAATAEESRSAS